MAEFAPEDLNSPNVQARSHADRLSALSTRGRTAYLVGKHTLNLVISVITLALLSPLLLIIGLAIVLLDSRPVLYRREVIALCGRPFFILEFRTMRSGAEKMLLGDPDLYGLYRLQTYILRAGARVTRFGRFLREYSLDDLPHLWNVIRGETSLVGPRCVPEFELLEYGDFAPLRQTIPPGRTGLWQGSGHTDRRYADWIRLDREYILRSSFCIDVGIILRTLPAVARGIGAY
jgi:lipopolysaccharide/colanic/teichoic acid biosynthesis glycosyltransferase